jgi:molecular chaperone GrpE
MKKEKLEEQTHEHKNNEIKIERNSSKHEHHAKEEIELLKDELDKLKLELKSSNEKIEELEKESLDYKDKLLRKAAEFENYKKRTESEQQNLIKFAAENFIVKLLPTIDDFERTLKHIENAKDIDSIKEGIKLVYDKFNKTLYDQGVVKIDSIGKPFDVHYHEALMQKHVENVKPHTVVDEILPGYLYKERVIRHAQVIVSSDVSEENIASNENSATADLNNEGK